MISASRLRLPLILSRHEMQMKRWLTLNGKAAMMMVSGLPVVFMDHQSMLNIIYRAWITTDTCLFVLDLICYSPIVSVITGLTAYMYYTGVTWTTIEYRHVNTWSSHTAKVFVVGSPLYEEVSLRMERISNALFKNPDFLLKNVDFIIKTGSAWCSGGCFPQCFQYVGKRPGKRWR